jgi:hypothetical protein
MKKEPERSCINNMKRSARLVLFALVVFLRLPAGAQTSAQRIVAIGDIHGEFDGFVSLLQRTHLVDPKNRWSGGNATLVQLGDFLDRGPKARAAMDLLMSLQKDAPKQGGRVVVLMGNHEAMNLYGDLRYVTPKDYESFANDGSAKNRPPADAGQPAGFPERCQALSADGLYGKWIRTLPAVARISDTVFLHGGINPDLAMFGIDKINEEVATEIKSFDVYKQFMAERKIASPCSSLDERISAARAALAKAKGKDAEVLKAFLECASWLSINEGGPLWFRGYAQWTDAEGASSMDRVTQALKVSRFVVGHTVQSKGEILSRFDGRVYLIDTGMLASYFPGGRASALIIQDGKVSTFY